jgi:hypothetical protein
MKMLQRIGALALLVVVVGGCSVQLKTAAAPVQACEDALGSGRLVANAQSGLGFADPAGAATPILWPFGYSARRGVSGLEILDETGVVVAREGDFVQAGGGTGNDGFFAVCAGSVQVVPAPG